MKFLSLRENTYNNVLYRGIPKARIGSLYLPDRFEQDILLVSGQEPIADVRAKLTSDLFTGFSVKKLMEFRRHLQGEGFYKKIRFFKEGNAKAVEGHLKKDGCQFASVRTSHRRNARVGYRAEFGRTEVSKSNEQWFAVSYSRSPFG